MVRRRVQSVAVSVAKRQLGELAARVAYGGESIILTRHGRPMVRMEPVTPPGRSTPIQGWLDDDDPFFSIMQDVVASRRRHRPRAARTR